MLIQHGTVVTAAGARRLDVRVTGERIAELAPHLDPRPGEACVAAAGRLVLPGFIDPHVHVYLPAMGMYAKDSYETAGRAALLGGTTTLFDFVLPERDERPGHACARWRAQADGRACCDYGLHLGITRFHPAIAAEVRTIVAQQGIRSFKVHLAYPDTLALTEAELYETLALARELDVLVMGHCEQPDLVEHLRNRLAAAGHREPAAHGLSRPPLVEADGTHHFLTLAALTGARAYVVHLSCREALDVARGFQAAGYPVWIETLIQFLLLDESLAARPGRAGAAYVMSPPLRSAAQHASLWNALAEGTIATVATDHAPFDLHGQKDRGLGDFRRIVGGLPGLQDRIRLLYTYGVCPGRISLARFVAAAAEMPARLFGLYPRKGAITIGADADLVIYDPEPEEILTAAGQAMNVDYNTFEGWRVRGRVEKVFLRGQLVVEGPKCLAVPGQGRYLPR